VVASDSNVLIRSLAFGDAVRLNALVVSLVNPFKAKMARSPGRWMLLLCLITAAATAWLAVRPSIPHLTAGQEKESV
jgi:hypothetical protein